MRRPALIPIGSALLLLPGTEVLRAPDVPLKIGDLWDTAYAPALIAVGVLMIGSVTKIDFEDLTELAPAFASIVMMVFTYNIANGLTAGLVLYPIVKVLAGSWGNSRSCHSLATEANGSPVGRRYLQTGKSHIVALSAAAPALS